MPSQTAQKENSQSTKYSNQETWNEKFNFFKLFFSICVVVSMLVNWKSIFKLH